MNIDSPQDARNFLVGNGIVGLCPETQNLVACMDILSRMCSCDPKEAKQAKFNQCKQHYIAFASKAQNFSAILLQKVKDGRICFYLNNQLISTVSR